MGFEAISEYDRVYSGMGVKVTYGIHGRLGGRPCKWRGVGWWTVQMFSRIRTWSWPWIVGVVAKAGKAKRLEVCKLEENQSGMGKGY